MRAYGSLDQTPAGQRAIAIGSFDGVHLGHRRVIERTIAAAGERGLTATVVTFDPHPMAVLRPELAPLELSTPARKQALVAELGADELVRIRFDRAFSMLDHERFAEEVLARALGARLVIVGRNFHYGHRAQGSIESLSESGDRLGFAVEPAPLLEVGGVAISSSRIRDLITAGEVATAAELLGRPPWVEGTIVRGDGRGRELGFATANLAAAPHTAVPAIGIYAGWGHLDGERHPAAISIGYNPTFSDDRKRVRIEAHLLDFDSDVYGRPLRLDFSHRLRGEQRFDSVEELTSQVHRDIAAVRAYAHTAAGGSAA
jgi:riboflavin kinase/FMN adenylyltransferase